MMKLFILAAIVFSTNAFAAAFETVINGKSYCVHSESDLAFSYKYDFSSSTRLTYHSVEVLNQRSGKKDIYRFLGRQGSGRLVFKATTSKLRLGNFFYATDDRGSNTVGFIKAFDELGNPVGKIESLSMAYFLTSSYKVWVNCY